MKAKIYDDEKMLLSKEITQESAEAFAKDIVSRADFESNMRGSAAYREKICEVLVRRGALALREV